MTRLCPKPVWWFTMLLFLSLSINQVFSQTGPPAVTGTVTNETSSPMPGVTVVVTSESGRFTRSTQTSNDGTFHFNGLPSGQSYGFTFTHIGYVQKELQGYRYEQPKTIELTVQMEPGTNNTGEEVVVIGYGRATKRDVTGAVKSLKASEFNRGIINSPEELLQGKISGVNVTSASGEPGAIQNITVRGPGGVRSGSTPLFVIDGLALDNSSTGGATNPLSFLNPQDIESIDVLKDASATAIYGSRGANGVILVTTKKGKAGVGRLNYNVTGGISTIARALPVFSAAEYKQQVTALGDTLEDFGGATDWQKEITRTAFTQNHNLALSGGTDKMTYYASLGMQLQQGILKGNDLKRYTGRINLSQKLLNDRLVVEVNLSANNTVNNRPDIPGLIGSALSTNPTIPAYGSNGKPFQFENGLNPLSLLKLERDITTINRVVGNVTGALTIVKGLVYKINYGIDNSTSAQDLQSLPNTVPLRLGRLATFNNYNRNSLIENYLTYSLESGQHRLTALAGHSYQKIFLQGRGTSINNFSNTPIEPRFNPGLGTELTLANNQPSGYALINELQSFFSRVNYQFNDKYLLTATVRADGSSKFGENNKYGVFPSFSAAWVLTKEEFFPNTIFSNLKLRAGWGRTGNQEIPSKLTQAQFTSQVNGSVSYPLNPGEPYPSGTSYSRLANPDIQWEVSTQIDAGIDFDLFNGSLAGTLDYFRKVSDNILLQVISADPIQPSSTLWTNVKDMTVTNQGVELEMSYRHSTGGGLTYSVGGNVTFIHNVVENSPYSVIPSGSASGSGLTSATINGYINGEPIGSFYLQDFIGFDDNGLSVYRDVDKDGIISDKDRVPLGSALPNRIYSLFGTLAWKGFDVAINFNGVSGNKIYDNTANASFYKNLLAKGINTTPEAIAYPQESKNNRASVSSRFLKDGSYFRFNNLALGYNINTRSLGLADWISALRVSLTGQNLFVITPYNGYDPEVNANRNIDGVVSYGIDYLSYPKARSFLLGINVTF